MRAPAGPVETGPAGMVAPVPIGPGRGQNGPAVRKEPAHVNTLPCVHPVADSCAPSRMPAKQGQQIGGSSATAAAVDLLRFERGGSKKVRPFLLERLPLLDIQEAIEATEDHALPIEGHIFHIAFQAWIGHHLFKDFIPILA